MSMRGRIAVATVVRIVLIGSLAACTTGPGPTLLPSVLSQTVAPPPSEGVPETASPTAAAPAIPALSESFISPLHAYSVNYPAGWTVTPASAPWVGDAGLLWGDPALDDLHGTDVRFVAASQLLAAGQSGEEWLAARSGAPTCEGVSKLPADVPVGSAIGTVTLNGCLAKRGIAAGGVIYDVIVVVANRGYDFTLDGVVDATYVQALLATVNFATAAPGPSSAAAARLALTGNYRTSVLVVDILAQLETDTTMTATEKLGIVHDLDIDGAKTLEVEIAIGEESFAVGYGVDGGPIHPGPSWVMEVLDPATMSLRDNAGADPQIYRVSTDGRGFQLRAVTPARDPVDVRRVLLEAAGFSLFH